MEPVRRSAAIAEPGARPQQSGGQQFQLETQGQPAGVVDRFHLDQAGPAGTEFGKAFPVRTQAVDLEGR
jgi:hypothetical protein